MSRLERLALLAFFAVVIVLLATQALLWTLAGTAAGVVAGVVVAGRLNGLRTRMDATLGADEAATGFRPRRVVTRAVVQLAVLAGLLLPTFFVPFVGDQLFAGLAAAATGLPFVVTASRVRR